MAETKILGQQAAVKAELELLSARGVTRNAELDAVVRQLVASGRQTLIKDHHEDQLQSALEQMADKVAAAQKAKTTVEVIETRSALSDGLYGRGLPDFGPSYRRVVHIAQVLKADICPIYPFCM